MVEFEFILNNSIKDTSYTGELVFGGQVEQAQDALRNASPDLLDRLMSSGNIYESRFLIGLLLSSTPWDQLSPTAREQLSVEYSPAQANIKPFYGYWSLCPSSEGKMIESIEDRSAMLVNDTLLVKGKGYKTGLAIRTVSTPGGTFFQGGWYSPINETMRIISDQLDRGTERLDLDVSNWAYMRDITKDHSEEVVRVIMARARAYTPIVS